MCITTMVFKDEMTVMLGKLEVRILHLGPGRGIKHPRIWTAKRDREMWKSIS
jgi:hypothetical protein